MLLFQLTSHPKSMIPRDNTLSVGVRNIKDLIQTLRWTRDMISDVGYGFWQTLRHRDDDNSGTQQALLTLSTVSGRSRTTIWADLDRADPPQGPSWHPALMRMHTLRGCGMRRSRTRTRSRIRPPSRSPARHLGYPTRPSHGPDPGPGSCSHRSHEGACMRPARGDMSL